MHKFYYDFIQKKCKNVKILYTDTDSFIIEITNEDFDEVMFENKEFFDLSNFSKDSKYYCADNKKVPGKMKHEYGGRPIIEYAGTKSKSYTLIDVNNSEKSAHKGHNSNIRSSEFKDVSFNKKVIGHDMRGIKSKNHNITTYEKNNISLSQFDHKRHIFKDGINTLAFGHKDIPKIEQDN